MKCLDPFRLAAGVALTELMVASALFSVVLLSGLKFFSLEQGWAFGLESGLERQQQTRNGLDFITRELGRAGYGLDEGETSLLKAEEREIEFLGNLKAVLVRLAGEAGSGSSILWVSGGVEPDAFSAGKTVSVCDRSGCERHRLAKNGTSGVLFLEGKLGRDFPGGSSVQVINLVRFRFKPTGGGRFMLVRTVDGGATPVAEGLPEGVFSYRDEKGEEVNDPRRIRRVRIRFGPPEEDLTLGPRSLVVEVFLRNG